MRSELLSDAFGADNTYSVPAFRREYSLGVSAYLIVSVGSFKETPLFSWIPIDLFPVVLLVSVALSMWSFTSLPRLSPAATVWLTFFFLSLVPGIFGAANYGIVAQVFLVVPAIIFVGYAVSQSPVALKGLLDAAIIVAFIVSVILFTFAEEGTSFGRLVASGAEPINSGRTIAFGAVCGLIRFALPASSWFWRIVGWSTFAIHSFVLVLVASRGPTLSLFVCVAFLSVITSQVRKLLVIAAIPLLVAVVIGLVAGLDWLRAIPMFARLMQPGQLVGAFSGARSEAFDLSWQSIKSEPFGVGWGNFSSIDGAKLQYPHNLFLEIGVDAGWIAIVSFSALVSYLFVIWIKHWDSEISWSYWTFFVFWFVSAMFSSTFIGNRGVWLFSGCLVGYSACVIATATRDTATT